MKMNPAQPLVDLASRTKSAYDMTSMVDAMSKIQDAIEQIRLLSRDSEAIDLSSPTTVGRTLVSDVLAPCDVPSSPCSRLDGYAVRSSSCTAGMEYAVHHRRRAGHTRAAPDSWPEDSVCYITTGAPLPPGADAIVKVEDTVPTAVEGGQVTRVRILASAVLQSGEGVRPAGSDVQCGTVLLPSGHVLTPLDCATLLSARVAHVQCKRAVRVGVLSTGDELVDAGSCESGEDAVIDSNRPMLLSLLSTLDSHVQAVDLGRIGDRYEDTVAAIQEGARHCDVLISTGAVSMGDRDYVKPALESCGRVLFGRLNMKPGKPTTCASITSAGGNRCLAFALPGNPVSVVVCFHMLVAPAIRALYGLPWSHALPPCVPVTVADVGGLACDGERPEYHRAVVWWGEGTGQGGGPGWYPGPGIPPTLASGTLLAASTGGQASSRMASTTCANALLWLPAGGGVVAQGCKVAAYLISPIKSASAVPELMRTGHAHVGVDHHAHGCNCGREHAPSTARPPHVLHGLPAVGVASVVPTPTGTVASSKAVVIQRMAIVTVSDTAAAVGKGADSAGPALLAALAASCPGLHAQEVVTRIIPDDYNTLVSSLRELCDVERCELIVTTGGTGCGVRDVTPEATKAVLHKECPGIVHTMLTYSLGKTPMAALSRYSAGIRVWSPSGPPAHVLSGPGTLIINMPGSPKAVKECVEAIKVVLPHAVALATGK